MLLQSTFLFRTLHRAALEGVARWLSEHFAKHLSEPFVQIRQNVVKLRMT